MLSGKPRGQASRQFMAESLAAAGSERKQADRAMADAAGRRHRAAGDAAPGLGRAMADAFGGGGRALDGSLDRPGGISRQGKTGNEKCCESRES
jgi:hypothetical protein